MITIKQKIPNTQEEFDSVLENNRPTLSEQLHGNPRKGSHRGSYRANYDSLTKEFTIQSEEF